MRFTCLIYDLPAILSLLDPLSLSPSLFLSPTATIRMYKCHESHPQQWWSCHTDNVKWKIWFTSWSQFVTSSSKHFSEINTPRLNELRYNRVTEILRLSELFYDLTRIRLFLNVYVCSNSELENILIYASSTSGLNSKTYNSQSNLSIHRKQLFRLRKPFFFESGHGNVHGSLYSNLRKLNIRTHVVSIAQNRLDNSFVLISPKSLIFTCSRCRKLCWKKYENQRFDT